MLTDEQFNEQLSAFPCTFHLDLKHVNKNRIKERRTRLELELNNSTFEIRKVNFLMWVYNQLKKYKKAVDVIERYKDKFQNNITSLANMAIVLWNSGYELKADDCLNKLKQLKSSPIFPSLLLEAQAESAFSYKKMGGILNLSRAVELYTEVVEAKPEDMTLRLELGITYRRTTHPRISMSEYFKNDPIVNRIQKAADLFFTVANSDVNNKTRSRAYVELAVMRRHTQKLIDVREYHDICRGMSVRKLCLEALKICEDDPRVLCECGRVLHEFDWNSAIEVLEKSVNMMPHTVAYHHLAIAYGKRAKRLTPEEMGIKWKSISQDPKGAITQFNKIIKSLNPSMQAEDPSEREHGQHKNIISAYEQIGLCYLAMYKKATGLCDNSQLFYIDVGFNVSADSETDSLNSEGTAFNEGVLTADHLQFKETSDIKLMQAIRLAARYCKEAPHNYEINVWKSYVQLKSKYNSCDLSKLSELLMLCGKYKNISQIVEDLKNQDTEKLKQPTLFTGALKSYLSLGKYELALALMNALLPHVVGGDGEELQTLEIQVNLCAAASRLEHPEEGISDLFQHVLDLQFWGRSPKATTQQTGSNDVLNSCVDEQANYLDVLILYDDSDNDDGSLPDIVTKAQQLKKLMKQTFNLRVKCNKERDPVGLSLYPEEMLFFKTVIVLVDGETEQETRRDRPFPMGNDPIPCAKTLSYGQRPYPVCHDPFLWAKTLSRVPRPFPMGNDPIPCAKTLSYGQRPYPVCHDPFLWAKTLSRVPRPFPMGKDPIPCAKTLSYGQRPYPVCQDPFLWAKTLSRVPRPFPMGKDPIPCAKTLSYGQRPYPVCQDPFLWAKTLSRVPRPFPMGKDPIPCAKTLSYGQRPYPVCQDPFLWAKTLSRVPRPFPMG
ncbi:hypothetical protein Btru_040583 [Bulinus truncatus]|nr:hypothetical protein Btru_040583 [Bulinus truncatus]